MPTIELSNPNNSRIKNSNKLIFAELIAVINTEVNKITNPIAFRQHHKTNLLLEIAKTILTSVPNQLTPNDITIEFTKTSVSDHYVSVSFIKGWISVQVVIFLNGTTLVTFFDGSFNWCIKTSNPIDLTKETANLTQVTRLLANIPSYLNGDFNINLSAQATQKGSTNG